MSPVLHVLITIGAAARLTRLATRDTITQPLREKLLYTPAQRAARTAGQPLPAPANPRSARLRLWAYELVTCDWCAGLWISTAAVALASLLGPTPWLVVPGAALAASYAVGWLAAHE